MSEDTKPAVTPPEFNIVIERGDVALKMEPFKILKGKRADTFYPAPKVTIENLPQIIQWIGNTNLVNELQTLLKRKFQSIASDSVSAEGVFDEALFTKYAVEFSSAGMKLKELTDKIEELSAIAVSAIDKGTFSLDGVEYETFSVIDGKPKASVEFQKLNDSIRAYRQMKEDRQRKPKEEETEEASVPA